MIGVIENADDTAAALNGEVINGRVLIVQSTVDLVRL